MRKTKTPWEEFPDLDRYIDRIAARLIRLSASKAPSVIFMGEVRLLETFFKKDAERERKAVKAWKKKRLKK